MSVTSRSSRTSPLHEQSSSSSRPPVAKSCSSDSSDSMTQSEAASPAGQRSSRSAHISGRRKLKSALFFALTILACVLSSANAFSNGNTNNRSGLSQRRTEWIERSVQYYSNVMKKNNANTIPASQHTTQIDSTTTSISDNISVAHHDKEFVRLATNHYYARFLIKVGKWGFAEKIYRRIIDELTAEEDDCDHTKLAVSTLLLALHMQRTGDIKATRAVFVDFFRRVAVVEEDDDGEVHKCSCSAKVLQAYALFEMKNGLSAKSLEIIQLAVKMDEKLSPVLAWKQFRDAAAGREYVPVIRMRKSSVPKSKVELSP